MEKTKEQFKESMEQLNQKLTDVVEVMNELDSEIIGTEVVTTCILGIAMSAAMKEIADYVGVDLDLLKNVKVS